MRLSIFNQNHNNNYKDEYKKMIKILNSKCVVFDKKEYTYFDYINIHLFNNWKYRSTYLDCYEYLESIGISFKNKKINKDSFLNLLEFILNMQLLMNSLKYYSENTKYSVKCKSIIIHNIPLLLETYGYEAYSLDDKIMILEKDINYESLMEILPSNIHELLLSYKNINNNGIKTKRIILNKIYEYINKDPDKYKNYSTSTYNSIKTIITKMGVIGDIDKKYRTLSNYKIKRYYDNCFEMIVYLLETENILKYKEELKKDSELLKKS